MAVKRKQSHNTFFGTAAEMAAFTDCRQGDRFIQTDTGAEYTYSGTAWFSSKQTLAHTTATIGASTGAALAANANRKYALLVNDSDAVIYLKIGAAAVLNQGIRLNANGGSYEMSAQYGNLDSRVINAISSSANNYLLITEGV